MIRLTALLLSLVLVILSCTSQLPVSQITSNKNQAHDLSNLGQFVRMVPLETHKDALLGEINEVAICPHSGDILLSDTRIGNTVYRFSAQGKYIRKYGEKGFGPGEYQKLVTFTVLKNGNVAVFSLHKRLLYQADGTLIVERNSGMNDLFAQAIGEHIVIYSMNGIEKQDTMVTILNQKLDIIEQFHAYEKRIEKFRFTPLQGLAVVNDQIVVSHFTDFKLSVYEPSGHLTHHMRFPTQNADLYPIWDGLDRKQPVYREQQQYLFHNLQRAEYVHGVGKLLHIVESQSKNNIWRSVIWDATTGEATTYTDLHLFRAPEDASYFSMSQLAGSYDKGLIGLCTDPELFARFQHQFPFAADIQYSDTDNPLLVFFELKAPQTQLAKHERTTP